MGPRRLFIKKKKRHLEVFPYEGFNFYIVEVFERQVFLDLWVHGRFFRGWGGQGILVCCAKP